MKKFRFIILALAIFATMGVCLVGCNNSNEKPINNGDNHQQQEETNSVLTVDETKRIVLKALSIDNMNTLGINNRISQTEDGNRNIFVKLGTATLLVEWDYTDISFFGILQKNLQGDVVKYSIEHGDRKEYFDGQDVYEKSNDNYSVKNYDTAYGSMMINSFDCVFLDLLFIDEAWDTLYNSEVNKTITAEGYDLDLVINMNKYCDFVMDKSTQYGLGAEGLFGDGEVLEKNKTEGEAKLKIKMKKNSDITALIFDFTTFSTLENCEQTKLTVEKNNGDFTAPRWFNAEDYK